MMENKIRKRFKKIPNKFTEKMEFDQDVRALTDVLRSYATTVSKKISRKHKTNPTAVNYALTAIEKGIAEFEKTTTIEINLLNSESKKMNESIVHLRDEFSKTMLRIHKEQNRHIFNMTNANSSLPLK